MLATEAKKQKLKSILNRIQKNKIVLAQLRTITETADDIDEAAQKIQAEVKLIPVPTEPPLTQVKPEKISDVMPAPDISPGSLSDIDSQDEGLISQPPVEPEPVSISAVPTPPLTFAKSDDIADTIKTKTIETKMKNVEEAALISGEIKNNWTIKSVLSRAFQLRN